jgi:hypothetical protein
MYSPSKRYRNAASPPAFLSGQKRWHMIFGLLFGVRPATWAFSGMLSMDPFPTTPAEPQTHGLARVANALRGARFELTAFSERHPSERLRAAGNFGAREIETNHGCGEPMYVAYVRHGDEPLHSDQRRPLR